MPGKKNGKKKYTPYFGALNEKILAEVRENGKRLQQQNTDLLEESPLQRYQKYQQDIRESAGPPVARHVPEGFGDPLVISEEQLEARRGRIAAALIAAKKGRVPPAKSIYLGANLGGAEPSYPTTYPKPSYPKTKAKTKANRRPYRGEAYANYGDIRDTFKAEDDGTCRDPECGCSNSIAPKEKSTVSKYVSGDRVSVLGLGPRKILATVIDSPGATVPAGQVEVCLDIAVGPENSSRYLDGLAGPGHGVVVRISKIKKLVDQTTYKAFKGIPQHIGVVVHTSTEVDNVQFQSGQTGRLVRRSAGTRVMINWNHKNEFFYESTRNSSDRDPLPRGEYTSCYNVPTSMLSFCQMGEGGRLGLVWPGGMTFPAAEPVDFKEGDYLRLAVDEAQKISNGQRQFRIGRGTILQYHGPTADPSKSHVVLIGGCDSGIIGVTAIVNTRTLEKVKEAFVDAGGEVEITANLSFRKRDLRGMRAIVLLPLDQDGEVGLQFGEDIGAGSLDGYGEDRKCLYVHHSDMSKVSG